MGLGGLIAGALGGAAKGYVETSQSELRKQQSLDLQKQMMAMEEEKQLRMDEIRRNRDITQKKREIEEIDPLKANSDANRTRVVGGAETDVLARRENELRPGRVATATAMGEAETGVLAGREDALRPGKVATGRAMGEAQGEVERGNLAKYGSDPEARKGVRAKAQDSETPSQRAAAAASSAQTDATRFDLAQKRLLADYRQVLANESDPEARKAIQTQIQDMSGASTKSHSDMVSAGNGFRMMANNLRQQLKDDMSLTEPEQADVRSRIRLYEEQAAAILGATVDARMGGSARTGAPDASGGRKVGDTTVIQAGPNKGKTARWDGKGWTLVN